jgi:hypothetical protein
MFAGHNYYMEFVDRQKGKQRLLLSHPFILFATFFEFFAI